MRGERELASLTLVSKLIKQQLGDISVTESPDKMDHYDLLVEWNNKNIFIEVKERMNNYVQLDNFIKYSNEGWQCEQIKWDFLTGKASRYINLFRINGEIVIITWNLNEIKHVSQTLRSPATTSFNTNHYKDKESILLKPQQGVIYIHNLESDRFDIIEFDTLVHKLNKNVLQRS